MRNNYISFKELIVWKKSIQLAKEIYRLTKVFPKEELYCLTSQMRRSAISISSNIAEGKNRGTKNDFKRFLFIAYGSASELQSQLCIVNELSYCSTTDISEINKLLIEILKMLNRLISSLT